MLSLSEREREHFRTVAELIYQGKPDSRERLNLGAKQVLAEIKHTLPDLDDQTAGTFLASIGQMIAYFSQVPVKAISDLMETTFDHHMLAVAAMAELINLDECDNAGPTVDELVDVRKEHAARMRAQMEDEVRAQEEADKLINRQYL